MQFNEWWIGQADESYWLEVTDRKDLGVDLNAPQHQDNGTEYYGYSLIQAIKEGDIVFHYHKDHQAIIAWSRATGKVWQDDIVWGARGTTARAAGVRPYVRPGWRLGLAGTAPLAPVVSLREIRERQDEIQAVRGALELQYGKPIYFPFDHPQQRDLRPTQAYLTKLPVAVARLMPGLDSVARKIEPLPPPSYLAETRAGYGLGASYRPADETTAISERDPFSVDPALVERAIHGHAVTQNELAHYLQSKGIDPRSPTPDEPNYDIAWMKDSVIHVAEVKSLTSENEEKQLRLGLGQVLRYRYLLSQGKRRVCALLIAERRPTDASWLAVCNELGIRLVWPESFPTI